MEILIESGAVMGVVEEKCLVVEAKKYLFGQPSPMEAQARWSRYLNAQCTCKCGNCPKN